MDMLLSRPHTHTLTLLWNKSLFAVSKRHGLPPAQHSRFFPQSQRQTTTTTARKMKVLEKVLDMCCADGSLGGKLASKLAKKEDKTTVAATATDAEDEVSDDAPKSKIAQQKVKKTGKDGFCNKDVKFDDLVYAKLPLHVQKAATVLGFDEESWDKDGSPPIEHKHWHDLTPEEKEAAETLGWSEPAWDHKYEHSYWKEIPDVVKKAAESVGFDEAMWDSDEWPESLKHKSWDELTKQEKRAMNVFGYHKNVWD